MKNFAVKFLSRYLLISFVFVAVSAASCKDCSKTVDCPGFADALLTSWFPYQGNDIISFSSSTGTEIFHVQILESTTPYQIQQGGFEGSSGNCNAIKSFRSTELQSSGANKFYLNLQSYLPAYSRTPERHISMSIFGTNINGYYLKENGFSGIDINQRHAKIEFFPSLNIGNKTFNNVQKANLDENLNNGLVYQVYIEKENGLIGYTVFPSTEPNIKQ